jgi:hypothetical protein
MGPLRLWVMYAFIVTAGVTGIDAISKGAVYPGIAGIIGAASCLFAGSGFKGSLILRTTAQRLSGKVAALGLAVIGIGLVYHCPVRSAAPPALC